jgi:hypothetical protein
MPADPDAFLYCDLLRTGQSGSWDLNSHRREHVEEWFVILDPNNFEAPNFTGAEVIQCPNLPGIRAPHLLSGQFSFGDGGDYLAFLNRYTWRQDKDWFKWFVTCYFTTESPVGGFVDEDGFNVVENDLTNPSGAQNQPWKERRKIEWGYEVVRRARGKDLTGKAYLNAAKMPFTPAHTTEAIIRILTITKNYETYDLATEELYDMVVNADTFKGRPPGSVLAYPGTVEELFRGDQRYFRITTKLRFAPRKPDGTYESWQPQILNQGMYQLKMVNIAGIRDRVAESESRGTGCPVTQPVLLDLDGTPLPLGDGFNPDTDPNLFLDFTDYDEIEFNDVFDPDIL